MQEFCHIVLRPGRALRDEDGSMTILALFFFLVMIIIGGISVDLMIFENDRTRRQNLADRAVLAAADMEQTLDPEEVVQSYFDKAGMGGQIDSVSVSSGANERRVSVVTSRPMRTMFMRLSGVDELTPRGLSTAIEGITDIEISMVLDVSGSMGRASSAPDSASKLDELQKASKRFIDTVYAQDSGDRITTTIVPYSTQVNAGPDIMAQLPNATDEHDFSHCIEFDSTDFATTALDLDATYQRAGHFDMWNRSENVRRTVCRVEWYNHIAPLMGDPATIKDRIDALAASGQTSIATGLKWGAAFLDPSTRPMAAQLPGIAEAHETRPFDYDEQNTRKYMVLLTDGVNTTHKRLRDAYLDGPSFMWKYISRDGEAPELHPAIPDGDSISGAVYSLAEAENGDEDGDGIPGEGYWVKGFRTDGGTWIGDHFRATPFGTDPEGGGTGGGPDPASPWNVWRMTWPELWADMPVKRVGHDYVRDVRNSYAERNAFYGDVWRNVTGGAKDHRMKPLCDQLRSDGVTVFAIGFEVNDHAAGVMRDCASTPNHFIRVVGDDLEDAFDAIASNISQLRLTQ